MPRYIHPHSLVPWEWLYHAKIYPSLLSSSMGVIISCHSVSTPLSGCMGMTIMITITWCISTLHKFGIDYNDTILYFHSRQNLMRWWIYRNVIFSFPTIFGGGHYIVTLYFHPWQYLVRRWLYSDIIFSLLTILVRGWLDRDIIFSLPAIFGEGVIISWHNIFTPGNIWWGVIVSWHYSFTPGNIWWGGDHIVTLYFHSWQYSVRGWLYRDVIFSLLAIFGAGVIT